MNRWQVLLAGALILLNVRTSLSRSGVARQHAPSVRIVSSDKLTTLGSDTIFKCQVFLSSPAERVDNIWWSLNGTAIDKLVQNFMFGSDVFTNEFAETRPLRVAFLRFTTISLMQTGFYRCHANMSETSSPLSSMASMASMARYLEVMKPHQAPIYYPSRGNYIFTEGDLMAVECAFYGSPPLVVQIVRNGTYIALGHVAEVNRSKGLPYPLVKAVYKVKEATVDQGGEYVCVASQILLNSQDAVNIYVNVKPKPFQAEVIVNRPMMSTADRMPVRLLDFPPSSKAGEQRFFISPEDISKATRVAIVCKVSSSAQQVDLTWHFESAANSTTLLKAKNKRACSARRQFCSRRKLIIPQFDPSANQGRYTCLATFPTRNIALRSSVTLTVGESPALSVVSHATTLSNLTSRDQLIRLAQITVNKGVSPLPARLSLMLTSSVTNWQTSMADLFAKQVKRSMVRLFHESADSYILVGFPGRGHDGALAGDYSLILSNTYGQATAHFTIGTSTRPV